MRECAVCNNELRELSFGIHKSKTGVFILDRVCNNCLTFDKIKKESICDYDHIEIPKDSLVYNYRIKTAVNFNKNYLTFPQEFFLGIDFSGFKKHIEGLFLPEMNWQNRGNGSGKWHLDHRMPISSGRKEEDFRRLSHYSNIQPLWCNDNLKKHDSIIFSGGNMTLGEQIKTERERQKLSQDALKTKAGVSLDTLRRMEKDKFKNPSYFVIVNIEKALNIKFEI